MGVTVILLKCGVCKKIQDTQVVGKGFYQKKYFFLVKFPNFSH